jgi:hypothetical protein
MNSKRKYKRKPMKRPVRGPHGLTREGPSSEGGSPVSVRSPSGLSHPVRGKLGRSLAER